MSSLMSGPQVTEELRTAARAADALHALLSPSFRLALTAAISRKLVADGVPASRADESVSTLRMHLDDAATYAAGLSRAGDLAVSAISECRSRASEARATKSDEFVL